MINKPRLLTPGPTPLPERVRLALAGDMIHHRKPEFKAALFDVEKMLQTLFGTSQPVLPLSCSGTGAMTAAVHSLFAPGEKVVVVNGGKFGERWIEIARVRGLEVVSIDVAWGQVVTPAQVEETLRAHPDAKGLLVQICETSTGAQHPVELLGRLTKTRDMLLVADGISAVGISPCRMDDWGIDCLLTGSQKGLMVPPGLALLALSARAWKRAEAIPVSCFYFNLVGERDNLQKGQSLFTSPVNLILGLRESLHMIFENGGLDTIYRKQWALVSMVRAGVKTLGLPLFAPSHFAWGVTSILLPSGVDGTQLLKVAAKECGVIFAGGQDDYTGRMVRFGHMGWVDWSDALAGLHALAWSLRAVGGFTASRDYLETALAAYHQALNVEPGRGIPDVRS
ncbi:MAG: alanine--glyoxylate aminotransferase family protein [Bilophila sp.]